MKTPSIEESTGEIKTRDIMQLIKFPNPIGLDKTIKPSIFKKEATQDQN